MHRVISIGFVLVIVLVLFVFPAIGEHQVDSKPFPQVSIPFSSCDYRDFLAQYNFSSAFSTHMNYNSHVYSVLTLPSGQEIPFDGEGCAPELDPNTAQEVISYKYLATQLYGANPNTYRNIAVCYSVSAGARPFCDATSATKNLLSNGVVQTAADNEKSTVSIVSKLTQNSGWQQEIVDASKGVIRLSKEINGVGIAGLTFDVVDTTSCYFKDSVSVQIYDYALNVGDTLWYQAINRNYYAGMGDDIKKMNEGLGAVIDHPDAVASLNNFIENLRGRTCGSGPAQFDPILAGINTKIDQSKPYGAQQSMNYLAWITPYKSAADDSLTALKSTSKMDDAFSLWGHLESIFFFTKSGDYSDAGAHYGSGNDYYTRGLFISAKTEYDLSAASLDKWRQRGLGDYLIPLAVFCTILGLILLFLVFVVGRAILNS